MRSRLSLGSVGLALSLLTPACGDPPAPAGASSAAPARGAASAAARASATPAPGASAAAPATSATAGPETPGASGSASAAPDPGAAPSASAASSASAAPLVPAEAPAPLMPTESDFAEAKEIAVRASSEQQCSTKVVRGWFELVCPPAAELVRATKVEVLSGFDGDRALLEIGEKSVSMRWVAPLPASGERAQARLTGARLHEIFLTLDHDAKGWKGALTGKKPD